MKFGIIGKNWGKNYARLLEKLGYKYEMTGKNGAEEVIKKSDCVIIASPTETHFEYIKKSLDKHILVEKPMGMSLKEAEEVREMIKDKVFMVARQYLYNDSLPKIELKHATIKLRYPVENVFWEVAPHAFSILDWYGGNPMVLLDIKKGRKYRKFVFNGEEWPDKPTKEPLLVELEHFIDCVKSVKIPLTDIEHGIRVIRNMEAYENRLF